MNRSPGVAMLAMLTAFSPTPGDDTDSKRNELNSKWDVVNLVVDGRNVSIDRSPDKFWFEIDGNAWRYSFVVDGKRASVNFSVALTQGTLPHAVDAKLQNGGFANMVCKGIRKHEGDTFKLCLASEPSAARPETFESVLGSNVQLFVIRRAGASETER